MSLVHENPAPALEFDSEVVIVIEDGKEWSPFDKDRLAASPADWRNVDGENCHALRAADIIAIEQKSTVGPDHGAMAKPTHALAYSHNSHQQLANMFGAASPQVRKQILDTARQIEDAVAHDPRSFPLCDVEAANEPIRVACRLPLAIYFSVDDKNAQVLIRRIDGVFSET